MTIDTFEQLSNIFFGFCRCLPLREASQVDFGLAQCRKTAQNPTSLLCFVLGIIFFFFTIFDRKGSNIPPKEKNNIGPVFVSCYLFSSIFIEIDLVALCWQIPWRGTKALKFLEANMNKKSSSNQIVFLLTTLNE